MKNIVTIFSTASITSVSFLSLDYLYLTKNENLDFITQEVFVQGEYENAINKANDKLE